MGTKYLGNGPSLDNDILTKSYVDTQITNISLNDLSNVNIVTPSDGEGLIWNATAGEWQPGLVGGTVNYLNDVGDVNAPSPVDGYALVWNSTAGEWQAGEAGTTINSINDISDVAISSVADNELLLYDSSTSSWINQTLTEAGIASATHNHDTAYLGITATATNADKLDNYHASSFVLTSDYDNTDVLNKIKAVDGSGSGLDADLLDGKDSSQFLRSDAPNNNSLTLGTEQNISDTPQPRTIELATNTYFGGVNDNHTGIRLFSYGMDGWGTAKLGLQIGNDWKAYGDVHEIWHDGNDGAGSGLDSDLLDGKHASAFSLTSHNHDDRYYTETELTNASINPIFSTTVGFANDSGVLYYNDTNNETKTNWWSSKDGFYIRGDSNSVDNVVLKTGYGHFSQNLYAEGNIGTGGSVSIAGGSARMEYNSATESIDFVFV